MNKKLEVCRLISGAVFLLSGIFKSISISDFSDLILQYGFANLQFLAPLIVLAEVMIGLLLIFNLWARFISAVAVSLLCVFSVLYAYGLFFHGIEDCGCFGRVAILNTSPTFTFIRNAVLVFMLVMIWRRSENECKANYSIAGIVLSVMCITSFMSGNTFQHKRNSSKKGYHSIAVKDTALKDFITTSKDSTYLVFAFTYSCPHCLNSIENLKKYESSGAVDKVIGLAIKDPAERIFRGNFNPEFHIKNYEAEDLIQLTNAFPKAYYIKNDSIQMELSGQLPCAYVFSTLYKD